MAFKRNEYIETTYAELVVLKAASKLIENYMYKITDKEIYVTAISNNTFAKTAIRIIRTVKEIYYTPFVDTVGSTDSHYTGIYGQGIAQTSYPNSGFSDVYYAIWGAKMWRRNNSGADVIYTDNVTMGTGWTLVAYTDNKYYTDIVYEIDYDFDNELIYQFRDNHGNVFTNRNALFASDDTIDFRNDYTISIINNQINISILFDGSILNNYLSSTQDASIYDNSNSGGIYDNSNSGGIYDNSNSGDIRENLNGGSIYNNSNSGSIYYNSNSSNINNNSNSSNINNNSNTGDIRVNSNSGSINNNSNSSNIRDNSNNGSISNMTNTFSIISSTNTIGNMVGNFIRIGTQSITIPAGPNKVLTNLSVGSITLTLPLIGDPRELTIKRIDANISRVCTIAPGSGATINVNGSVGNYILPINSSIDFIYVTSSGVWYNI